VFAELLRGSDHRRTTCPQCSHQRKKHKDPCLSLNRVVDGVVYQCHHCGFSGKEKDMEQVYEAPKTMRGLHEREKTWLRSRGINDQTMSLVSASDPYFPKLGATAPAVAFTYRKGSQTVGAKYRAVTDKAFIQQPGSEQIFYQPCEIDPAKPLVITEGEMDALSCIEAGWTNVVSVPGGAPIKISEGRVDPSEDKKFSFIWEAKHILDKVPAVILAVDADIPGVALKEELARRIGKSKCKTVTYPEGCKDLNDVLVKHGEFALIGLLDQAQPWPIEGVFNVKHFETQVYDLYEKGLGSGESTGYPDLDELYTVVPGQLTVVTGYPSSGKSNFVDQLMVNLARDKQWKFAVCSFENPPSLHIPKLCELYLKQPFFDGPNPRMGKEDLRKALEWVSNHFIMLDTISSESTIDSILDRAQSAVAQLGVRGLVIDPYNFVDLHATTTETDAISRMLTRVQAFAKAAGIHVWFVAHPAKQLRQGESLPVPDGMSISGSMAWWAKADVGMTVHRKEGVEVLVRIWKCRWRWTGQTGDAVLVYDRTCGTYRPDFSF
jgi:twinkle protein